MVIGKLSFGACRSAEYSQHATHALNVFLSPTPHAFRLVFRVGFEFSLDPCRVLHLFILHMLCYDAHCFRALGDVPCAKPREDGVVSIDEFIIGFRWLNVAPALLRPPLASLSADGLNVARARAHATMCERLCA